MHLKILLNQGAGLLKKWGWAWQVRAFQSSLYLFWAYWGGGDDGDMTMMIWRWRWWWWRCYWWYCWWWWQRWLQGCGGCRSHGVWPSSRRPRRRKRCCRLYLFFGAISIYIGYIHFSIVESRAAGASGTFSLSWWNTRILSRRSPSVPPPPTARHLLSLWQNRPMCIWPQ